jgi:hypothetical protein
LSFPILGTLGIPFSCESCKSFQTQPLVLFKPVATTSSLKVFTEASIGIKKSIAGIIQNGERQCGRRVQVFLG